MIEAPALVVYVVGFVISTSFALLSVGWLILDRRVTRLEQEAQRYASTPEAGES